MEENMLESREVRFGVEDAKISKGYEIYRIIRFIVKNICIWGMVIILGILQAYEGDDSFVKYEEILETAFGIILITAIALVGLYLLFDSCIVVLSRKFKCKEEVSGTIEVEDVIMIEEQGITSYEFHLGLRYFYDDKYYVYRFVMPSTEKETYKDGDKLSVYINPKDPMYLMIEKNNVKSSGCIIKGIIGGIILAPFALLLTLIILKLLLEGLVFVLEKIQDMLFY